MRVVAVGEATDEFVRLRKTADALDLLVARVRIAPAEIFLDSSGKQQIFLQNDRDLIAQSVESVIAHVDAAYLDRALAHVVKAGDELDERGLAATRAADDTHRLAGRDEEVYVCECLFVGSSLIGKADLIEKHASVAHLGDGAFGLSYLALLAEHLAKTVCGLDRHREHNDDHRYHHKTHQYLCAIGQKRGEACYIERSLVCGDDESRAEEADHQHKRVEAELHQGAVEREDLLGLGKAFCHVVRRDLELLALVVLTDVCLDYSHTRHVFLNRRVERVVFLEYRLEDGVRTADDKEQTERKHGDDDRECERHSGADGYCHNEREH